MTTETQTTAEAPRFNGRHIEPIGGKWWRCTDCDGTIEADCECCEPPECNCARKIY